MYVLFKRIQSHSVLASEAEILIFKFHRLAANKMHIAKEAPGSPNTKNSPIKLPHLSLDYCRYRTIVALRPVGVPGAGLPPPTKVVTLEAVRVVVKELLDTVMGD